MTIASIVFLSSMLVAQDIITDAFVRSVELEAENKLGESIAVVSRYYDSTDYLVNYRCAHLCERMKDLYWADIYIKRSLRIAPNSIEAKKMQALIESQEVQKTEQTLIVDTIPEKIIALKDLSKQEMENNSLSTAYDNMNSYLSYFPSDLEGNLIAAHIRFDQGNYTAAKEYLQIIERLRPMFFLNKEFSTF